MSGGLLERIAARCRERLQETKRRESAAAVSRRADAVPPPLDFLEPLRRPAGLNVIAEFKPRSPTRGSIRPDADVAVVAQEYERSGACAMSVLTEPEFFGSGLDRLETARRACRLPLLRKDFLTDAYQVDEARAARADAVLLIVSLLDDAALRDLLEAAFARKMEALVEVHDEHEIERALRVGARVVGINQRDLRDLSIDRGLVKRLMPRLPPDVTVVAESGLGSRESLKELRAAGCHAFLIGSHLMAAPSPAAVLRELLG